MSRTIISTLAGMAAVAVSAGLTPAQAAPLPAVATGQVAGENTNFDKVGWRRGYYGPRYGGGYGYGYRRRNVGGALAAGAALGLMGAAIAASSRPRYYGYGYPAYGYGYGYRPYGYYPYGY